MGAYDDGGMTKARLSAALAAETKRENTRAASAAAQQREADQKLLEQAQALLAKQKATLEALEKQQAESRAAAEAAAKAAKAEETALKLAEMKRVREADLAAKAAARKSSVPVPQSSGVSSSSGLSTTLYVAPQPSPTPSTPATVAPVVQTPPPPPVKTAPIDTVLFNDEEVPIEVMSDLIFEDIGGQELINIARNDIINGQDISYQPIKNLTSIQQQYNPNNILSVQSTSDKYFSNFAIKLENKTPNVGNGPFGSNVYIDPLTGNMVVDAINLESDEQIEIEITLSGTIYEADLTGSES